MDGMSPQDKIIMALMQADPRMAGMMGGNPESPTKTEAPMSSEPPHPAGDRISGMGPAMGMPAPEMPQGGDPGLEQIIMALMGGQMQGGGNHQ